MIKAKYLELSMKEQKKTRKQPEDEVTLLRGQINDLEARVAELEATEINQKQTIRKLTAQYAVARILSESTSLNYAAIKILQAICESLQWELGVFWSLDRSSNSLYCVEVWHRPSTETVEFETVSRQRTFPP